MVIYCASRGEFSGSEAVYALLGHAFQTVYGGALPDVRKTPRGKPFFPERSDIHFSLSHARTHVLCALSGNPVGCDLESPRVISQRALKFFCSADELSMFDPLDLWVLKESYVKLFGWTVASMRELRLSREGDRIVGPDETVLLRLYRVAGCRAAVCSIGQIPPDSIELV